MWLHKNTSVFGSQQYIKRQVYIGIGLTPYTYASKMEQVFYKSQPLSFFII